jgi:hypothetical protein
MSRLLLVAVICVVASLSLAQDQAQVADTRPGPGPIDLMISLDHDQVNAGTPLVLTVTMANTAEEQHCYRLVRGYAMYNFDPEVLNSKGEKVGLVSTSENHLPRTMSSKTQCLQGRATLSQTMRLDELFTLATPDTYTVRVGRYLRGRSGDKVFSNSLTFKVLP